MSAVREESMTRPSLVCIEWVTICCGNCGLHWAVDSRWIEDRRNDGKTFCCPNGCRRAYHETEVDRERKARQRAEHQRDLARVSRDAALDQARAAEYARRAAKGQLTKTRKRIANGVCPCCKRSFVQLERHMATKHPNFAEPVSS